MTGVISTVGIGASAGCTQLRDAISPFDFSRSSDPVYASDPIEGYEKVSVNDYAFEYDLESNDVGVTAHLTRYENNVSFDFDGDEVFHQPAVQIGYFSFPEVSVGDWSITPMDSTSPEQILSYVDDTFPDTIAELGHEYEHVENKDVSMFNDKRDGVDMGVFRSEAMWDRFGSLPTEFLDRSPIVRAYITETVSIPDADERVLAYAAHPWATDEHSEEGEFVEAVQDTFDVEDEILTMFNVTDHPLES